MNLFRSEEHIARWLGARTPGATRSPHHACASSLSFAIEIVAPGVRLRASR